MNEDWAALDAALGARREPLRLWWRDDDAARWTPALDRLLALARRHAMPLALAAIPARLDPALPAALRAAGGTVAILQHGFGHRNGAIRGERAVELGGARETAAILTDLTQGRSRLAAAFGARFLPVVVPPWNRIERRIREALPEAGFRGLSAFGDGEAAPAGFTVANASLDVLRWRGGAHFAGEGKLLAETLDWLQRHRDDERAPFGLLTHHLDHDEATWDFLQRFLSHVLRHAIPVSAAHVFALETIGD